MHYVPFPSDSFLSHLVAVELLRAHPVLPLSSHKSSALSLSSEFVFYKIQFNFLQNLKNYELQNPRDGRSSGSSRPVPGTTAHLYSVPHLSSLRGLAFD